MRFLMARLPRQPTGPIKPRQWFWPEAALEAKFWPEAAVEVKFWPKAVPEAMFVCSYSPSLEFGKATLYPKMAGAMSWAPSEMRPKPIKPTRPRMQMPLANMADKAYDAIMPAKADADETNEANKANKADELTSQQG
jgi:hypothetical protein